MRIPVLACASVLLAAACVSEDDQALPVSTTAEGRTTRAAASAEVARRDHGLIRFVQAVPDVIAVDVYGNDMRLFTSVPYGTVTPYKEVPEDGYTVRIRPAGQEMAVPLAEEKKGVDEGKHYTAIAFRERDEGKAKIVVFEDRLTPPEGGSAKLRVINASPDVGELDLFTPGAEKPVVSGVDYMEQTEYKEIKPMTGKLQLHREDETTPMTPLPVATFDAGKVYTLIVLGWSRGSPPDLKTVIVEDRFGIP